MGRWNEIGMQTFLRAPINAVLHLWTDWEKKMLLVRVHVQAGSRFKPCARVGERGASPSWHPAATWAQSKGSKKRCVASVPLQYSLLGANPPLHFNLILQDWCFKRGSHMGSQNRTHPRPSDVTAPAQQLHRSQAVLMLTYCTRPRVSHAAYGLTYAIGFPFRKIRMRARIKRCFCFLVSFWTDLSSRPKPPVKEQLELECAKVKSWVSSACCASA